MAPLRISPRAINPEGNGRDVSNQQCYLYIPRRRSQKPGSDLQSGSIQEPLATSVSAANPRLSHDTTISQPQTIHFGSGCCSLSMCSSKLLPQISSSRPFDSMFGWKLENSNTQDAS